MRRSAVLYVALAIGLVTARRVDAQLVLTSVDGTCQITVPATWKPIESAKYAADHPDGGDIQLSTSHDADWKVTRDRATQYNVTYNHMTPLRDTGATLEYDRATIGSYEFIAVYRLPGGPPRQCQLTFGRNARTIAPKVAAQLRQEMLQIATTFAAPR
jgi:hypothetical protein